MRKKPAAKRNPSLAKRASAYRAGTGKKGVSQETFELPVPYTPSKPVVPMPPEIRLPAPQNATPLVAAESIRKKKQPSLAFTAILASTAISAIATAILCFAFGMSLALALPLFTALLLCVSITIYSSLENRAHEGGFSA